MCACAWAATNAVYLGASRKAPLPINSKALVQPRGMKSTATASINVITEPRGHCSAAPGVIVITVTVGAGAGVRQRQKNGCTGAEGGSKGLLSGYVCDCYKVKGKAHPASGHRV